MTSFTGKVTWLGHAGVLIESPRGARIAIDPFPENPKFPKGFAWGKVDVIAATHGHFDHFGDGAVNLAKQTGATVVGIFELALHAAAKGVAKTSGMNKGGNQTLAGISFQMVRADHSSGASPGDREATYAGEPCGYVMTFEDGFRIYHAGDTNVFSDMALIAELYAPDLALLPIGGFYTMGPREAAKACELLGIARVIPIHWGTFPVLTGTPQALRQELEKRKLASEVIELAPGQSWPG
jgi:L-ascorbate metabolism protein UlaG (beta-lactamase superfamily)